MADATVIQNAPQDNPDWKSIGETFSRAMVDTRLARWLIESLNDAGEKKQRTMELSRAMTMLDELKVKMPKYDNRLLGLLYILWYQPSHIRFIYNEIVGRFSKLEKGNDVLLVDLGCGAFAVQYAVAIAAARELQKGNSIGRITIRSMDSSAAMMALGAELWNNWKREIIRDGKLPHLLEACKRIDYTWFRPEWMPADVLKDYEASPWTTCWLTAIHVVYKENLAEFQKDLSAFIERLDPDALFASVAVYGGKTGSLTSVMNPYLSGYTDSTFRSKEQKIPAENAGLEGITDFRRSLINLLSNDEDQDADKLQSLKYNLNGEVSWSIAPAVFKCYRRKGGKGKA